MTEEFKWIECHPTGMTMYVKIKEEIPCTVTLLDGTPITIQHPIMLKIIKFSNELGVDGKPNPAYFDTTTKFFHLGEQTEEGLSASREELIVDQDGTVQYFNEDGSTIHYANLQLEFHRIQDLARP